LLLDFNQNWNVSTNEEYSLLGCKAMQFRENMLYRVGMQPASASSMLGLLTL
jgi:hypothetical protein